MENKHNGICMPPLPLFGTLIVALEIALRWHVGKLGKQIPPSAHSMLIEVKSQGLQRFAYFDRYLSEDEWMDAANARADIYELQWKRIEVLNSTNQTESLRDALKEYVNIIGYNQEAAETMLKQLNNNK